MKKLAFPVRMIVLLQVLFLVATNAVSVQAQKNPAKGMVTTSVIKNRLYKLPAVSIAPRNGQSDCFAILMSGDGGWSKFDQRVCENLAAKGIPVLGLNSLKYIWKAKTPEQITDDVRRMIAWGESGFGGRNVMLIGYSCGANLIPFAYNRLEDSLKNKISHIVLLSPEDKADFAFHWYNWANKNSRKARLVRPELEILPDIPVLFIYGDKEKYDWCADLLGDRFSLKILPGGHHYDRNELAVANEILHFKG